MSDITSSSANHNIITTNYQSPEFTELCAVFSCIVLDYLELSQACIKIWNQEFCASCPSTGSIDCSERGDNAGATKVLRQREPELGEVMVSITQLRAIAICPIVSGSISLISSIILIYIILRSHLRLTTTYHRISFALSCCDVFQSLSHSLSSIPAPKNIPILFSIGNQSSCNFQGFIYVFGFLSLLFYFTGLTGYFNLALIFEVSEEDITKYYETAVHVISIGYALFGAIFVLALDGYFTTGNICWIAPRPFRCEYADDVECTSGSVYKFLVMRWLFVGGPVFIGFFFVVINMMMIFWALLSQNKSLNLSMSYTAPEVNRHNGTDEMNDLELEVTPSTVEDARVDQVNEISQPSEVHPRCEIRRASLRTSRVLELYAASKKNMKQSKAQKDRKEAMVQALLYIFVFFICYFAIITFRIMEYYGNGISLNMYIISRVTSPLQGFGVFFIFIRPRFVNIKRRNPSYSLIKVLVTAIQSKGEMVQKRRRRVKTTVNQRVCRRRESKCLTPSNAFPQSSEQYMTVRLFSELPHNVFCMDDDDEIMDEDDEIMDMKK